MFHLSNMTTSVASVPHLSNVLLIYTCWAPSCLGIRNLLTSITQQALLLPFKIHLKRFTAPSAQLDMDTVMRMRYWEECLTVVDWNRWRLQKAKVFSHFLIKFVVAFVFSFEQAIT